MFNAVTGFFSYFCPALKHEFMEHNKTYGHFDDSRREYVINDPQTPYPWINYLGNDDFFSIISNTAGGYSFYRDARLRRLTRYRYNNVPIDSGGRYFYINDRGDIWSPGWNPVKAALDSYACRHGLGYTHIEGSRGGLRAEVLFFVPLGENAEVQQVQLTNLSDRPKSFTLFSFAEWCLWNAHDDMTNFQRNFSTGEVEVDGSTIYHKTEYRERRNHYAWYHVNQPVDGFDTDRDAFIGLYNGFDRPQAVLAGHCSQSEAHGWSPIAAHQLNVTLAPGDSKELVFVLGYTENPDSEKFNANGTIRKERAQAVFTRLTAPGAVETEMRKLQQYWDELLSVYQLSHPDPRLNRIVNIWHQYQCMVTFNMSRSASFFESGIGRGMGFRDSNQDLIGFVHQVPAKARQRIIDIASTQFVDGGCYHQYQPLTKRGNSDIGGNFNDDPMWLILSVVAYLKETGDFTILDEQVPFDNVASTAKSLFEHLTLSFNHVIDNLGEHGLPLIGRADWNDCLNLNCFSTNPDESYQTTENREGGKAESVMIAGLFVTYGKEYAELCDYLGKTSEAKRARSHIAAMVKSIESFGWDGEWFVRAYDHFGNKIGSKENDEGKIFIESQGWCIMAGVGLENGMARMALDSVNKYLACEYGIVLNHPPFSKYQVHMGEITSYPQGYKENAGIFCHNNPWIMIAHTILGDGDQAFDYYSRIAPAYLEHLTGLHKTEPYVYSQMIAGKDAFRPGEAKNSWLTGTAAWNFFTISRYILGVFPEFNGLRIDPCIPREWKTYTLTRKFRGAVYTIEVTNPDKVCRGIKSISVNGQKTDGNIIPIAAPGDKVKVEVVLG